MKLIIHGDDFGLTPGVNQGIAESFQHGILRSASLIASGEAFDGAVRLAESLPGLDLGVHLTLTDEKPLTAGGRSLCSGEFLPSRSALTRAIAMGALDMKAVEAELRGQIEKVLASGAAPSHLDSHQFVHLLPKIFPLCLKLRNRYNIPFMRTLLVEPWRPGAGPARRAQWLMLKSWTHIYVRPRIPSGLPVIPCTGFALAGGGLSPDRLLRTVHAFSGLPALEIMIHPGAGDDHTARKYAHWDYSWKQDQALCMDASLAAELKRRGLAAASFRDMAS